MNLLMVDDQISILSGLISGIDWSALDINKIRTSSNAEEAKKILSSEHVDIMLCDIEMPGDNGLALLRWARGQGMDFICIFLTSHADFLYAKEAMQLECFDYVLQPARYEEIRATVERAIRRVRKSSEQAALLQYGAYFQEQAKAALSGDIASAQAEYIKFPDTTQLATTPAAPVSHWIQQVKEEIEPKTNVVEEVEQYIEEHLEEQLSVAELAEKFYISPDYLSKQFREKRGQSLKSYILDSKMKAASILLKTTRIPISVIASRLGYDNFSHFSQAYKKAMGISPSDERKNNS